VRLTEDQRGLFLSFTVARGAKKHRHLPGPPLFSDEDRALAMRLFETGSSNADSERVWMRAKEDRDLTPEECGAAVTLLESETARRYFQGAAEQNSGRRHGNYSRR
jgi:hypothetical protein